MTVTTPTDTQPASGKLPWVRLVLVGVLASALGLFGLLVVLVACADPRGPYPYPNAVPGSDLGFGRNLIVNTNLPEDDVTRWFLDEELEGLFFVEESLLFSTRSRATPLKIQVGITLGAVLGWLLAALICRLLQRYRAGGNRYV
jgi:hypothetical protein